jgi:adenylate cyclase
MSSKPNGPSQSGSDRHSPPDNDIRQQLEKILASPEFQTSPMLCDFLRFVVEKTLSGCAQEIKGYTVATEVFGRKADFDAGKDTIVRIQGGRLRRALERYYLTIGGQDPIRIDIPKGAYVPTFHLVARAETGVDASTVAQDEAVLSPPPGPSVAVLPLLNLTGDRKQEFFADGLAEEITNELARYQDLRVIAFQSTLRWRGAKFDAREVGRDLHIRFFLEGSIRKEATLIKITVRLVDTVNGMQVWGDQYQRQLKPDKLIALQEEIAQNVAGKIGSEYGIISWNLSKESQKKPPESLDTYEAFLRFYHHVNDLTPETYEEALRVLEQAVTREPKCGLAWSLLALLYFMNHNLQFSPLKTPLEKALVFAKKGASLDSQNQQVRATMAFVYFFLNERDSFLLEVERTMALNPKSPFLSGYMGWLLALYGEWDRGLVIMRKGMELNPHYPGWFRMAPYFYFYHQGMYMEALQEAQQFQMPQFFWDPLLRAAVLGQLEREREAAHAVAELLQLKPDFSTDGPFLIGCYVRFKDLADALIDGLRKAGLQI